MKSKLQKQEKGFTIIEVLIVLAIAGLIILIVFLAVPSLQRNSRNTQRKNDIAALAGAMNEFINNNNGALPATCTAGATGCGDDQWVTNAGTLGSYTNTAIAFTNNTAAPTTVPTAPANGDSVTAHSFVKCAGTTATTTGATRRSVVLLYSVESGGGNFAAQCTEI
jgi:prepilin-type N-terminal cleavage/methylation domain-containing protein